MPLNESLLEVLQQRMDKCTTEQFWAVGAITGLDAFLLTQADEILRVLAPWQVIAAVAALALYGVSFVVSRHVGYFRLYDAQVDLVGDEPGVPPIFRSPPSRWSGGSLSGVLFYSLWIVVASAAAIMAYC